jgi:hypothetical protein
MKRKSAAALLNPIEAGNLKMGDFFTFSRLFENPLYRCMGFSPSGDMQYERLDSPRGYGTAHSYELIFKREKPLK